MKLGPSRKEFTDLKLMNYLINQIFTFANDETFTTLETNNN